MTKIIQRHDTAANWTEINPILASGEMGVETDTNKFKFGDGVTAWVDLAYAAGGSAELVPATANTLGGIKVGANLSITEDGVLSATGGGSGDAYTKAETDDLLNMKQDKLTAVTPLKIATETYKELNVKVISGNISDEYVYSHSSSESKAGTGLESLVEIPFVTANTWEIVVKTYFDGGNALIYTNPQYAGFYFGRYSNSDKCLFHISTNGTSWNHTATFSYSSFYQKDVYIKIEYTGSAYIASYSNDGTTFTELYTHSFSTKLSSNATIRLAQFLSSSDYYSGNIYLTDSYYKINGVKYPLAVIKEGTLTISNNPATTSSLGVVQPDGTSITVSETGIISGQDVKTFTGYSDTGTLVLKSINGVLQWVTEA